MDFDKNMSVFIGPNGLIGGGKIMVLGYPPGVEAYCKDLMDALGLLYA